MTGGLVDAVAAAIRKHQFRIDLSSHDQQMCCTCQEGRSQDGWMLTMEPDFHVRHQAEAVVEALEAERTITTAEHLDALPFLSVVREIFRTSPSGLDYGGLYERRTSGWQNVAGVYKDAPDNGPPKLPCRLLYLPGVSVVRGTTQ